MKTQPALIKALSLFFIVLTLVNCSSSNSPADNRPKPSVILGIFVSESEDDSMANLSAAAYSVDNFEGNWYDLGDLSNMIFTATMNQLEFHTDKDLQIWTETQGQTETQEVFVSPLATAGVSTIVHELTDFLSISKIQPGEYYNYDFTDQDGRVFSHRLQSRPFVGVTNLEDGDQINEDQLTVTWDTSLATGEIQIGLSYINEEGEKQRLEYENVSNTGSLSIDVSQIEGDFTLYFFHIYNDSNEHTAQPRITFHITQDTEIHLHR